MDLVSTLQFPLRVMFVSRQHSHFRTSSPNCTSLGKIDAKQILILDSDLKDIMQEKIQKLGILQDPLLKQILSRVCHVIYPGFWNGSVSHWLGGLSGDQ